MSETIMVFFDESGKGNVKPNLMGGVAIPKDIYSLPDFELLTQELKDKKLELHFKNYYGDSKDRNNFIRLGETFTKYCKLSRMIIINYDYSTLANRKEFGKDLVEDMIYTKFPERILYGLLRGYGKNANIEAEIMIENGTEYVDLNLYKNSKINLDDLVMDQLNIQALYRGENYVIRDASLKPKGEEIGVELTDMLLGIVRTILDNKESTGVKPKAKNALAMHLLRNNDFRSFMNNIKYFEWENTRELTEVDFNSYVQLFLAKHLNEQFQD